MQDNYQNYEPKIYPSAGVKCVFINSSMNYRLECILYAILCKYYWKLNTTHYLPLIARFSTTNVCT